MRKRCYLRGLREVLEKLKLGRCVCSGSQEAFPAQKPGMLFLIYGIKYNRSG